LLQNKFSRQENKFSLLQNRISLLVFVSKCAGEVRARGTAAKKCTEVRKNDALGRRKCDFFARKEESEQIFFILFLLLSNVFLILLSHRANEPFCAARTIPEKL